MTGAVREPERIVVGIDGSPTSRAAVRWAIGHARPGDSVTLVHAWRASPAMVDAGLVDPEDAAARSLARHELTRAEALPRGRAMADGVRRQILVRLLGGPAYPGELADELGSSRANISNHLACLRGCGLVRTTRQGRQVRYELADAKLAQALRLLSELVLLVEPEHCDAGGNS